MLSNNFRLIEKKYQTERIIKSNSTPYLMLEYNIDIK